MEPEGDPGQAMPSPSGHSPTGLSMVDRTVGWYQDLSTGPQSMLRIASGANEDEAWEIAVKRHIFKTVCRDREPVAELKWYSGPKGRDEGSQAGPTRDLREQEENFPEEHEGKEEDLQHEFSAENWRN
ncbi:hypothetical protein BTVI_07486 [Pitangus sulphuratus]|nr:hypothetical protein BTVI_07486 [Pitangus sulphuratus]